MANEPSFFQRLTGLGKVKVDDASTKMKRVDFSQDAEQQADEASAFSPAMPQTTTVPVETEKSTVSPSVELNTTSAGSPTAFAESASSGGKQSKSLGAVYSEHVRAQQNKREQWMEEAQEGQLTIDVYQTDTDIVIKSTVAGVKPEDIDIAITNDMVTIRGKRERDEEVAQDQYFYQECYWGPFSRTVILPADIAAEKAEATIHNGILTIRLPKIEKEQTKKIKVKPIP